MNLIGIKNHVLGPESQMFLYPHPLSSLAKGKHLSLREATAGPVLLFQSRY